MVLVIGTVVTIAVVVETVVTSADLVVKAVVVYAVFSFVGMGFGLGNPGYYSYQDHELSHDFELHTSVGSREMINCDLDHRFVL